MVKTHISSKGQTTVPARFRSRWKTSEVVWEEAADGSAVVRPVPDLMSLFGSAGSLSARIPSEKQLARDEWGHSSEGKTL